MKLVISNYCGFHMIAVQVAGLVLEQVPYFFIESTYYACRFHTLLRYLQSTVIVVAQMNESKEKLHLFPVAATYLWT